MGVLNVTPDSFSDGGQFMDPAAAVARTTRRLGTRRHSDIGAIDAAPAAIRARMTDRKARLAPVLPTVVKLGLPTSIDTIKASTAAWALDQGAAIVNDVWGLQRDPDIAPLVAKRGVPVIVMHNREAADAAIDIVADVLGFFFRSLVIAGAPASTQGHRARSGHRFWQDSGAKHDLSCPTC
jgi:dihydropteroate synthase